MIEPTETQSKVLSFVASQIKEGMAPSLKEISAAFGWTSHAAAAHHLSALEKKGYVSRRPGHRGLQIMERVP